MTCLAELIGRENPLDSNARALRDFARQQEASAVGALHVTCSDESERECAEAFQHGFAEDLLPSLKYSSQSPFRTANLGGRYEWGSVTQAGNHFSVADDQQGPQLLVVKINAHVAVMRQGSGFRYGRMRDDRDASIFCDSIHAALEGQQLPAIHSLAQAFRSEGIDRIAMLNDPSQVEPPYRSLLAAVTSARLQARRAVLDIQNAGHVRNSLVVVIPCVTVNRLDRDTEIVVGRYKADFRNGAVDICYTGLGDDPSQYDVSVSHNLVQIKDDQLGRDREARDHRRIVLSRWQHREGEVLIDDDKVREIVVLTERASPTSAVSKEVLKTLLRLLADVALVPTAILLFADGVAGIHNVYRAYRLATGQGTRHDAARILEETLARVDSLSPHEARGVISKLCDNYGISLEAGDEEDISPAAAELELNELAMTAAPADEGPATVVEDVAEQRSARQGDDHLTQEVAAHDAAVGAEGLVEASEPLMPSSPTMELELSAGSELEFSSMPEPSLSLAESAAVEHLASAGETSPSASAGAASAARLKDQRKAAEDEKTTGKTGSDPSFPTTRTASDGVSAEAPEIATEVSPIVDSIDRVTASSAPPIESSMGPIVDETKDVTEIETRDIRFATEVIRADEPVPVSSPEIRYFAGELGPKMPNSPLRDPHVIQPSTPQRGQQDEDVDAVIDAELISQDDQVDDIIIINDERRRNG